MADSASIGANFSDYQGSPNLGEVGLGVFNIDTRPLEQLSRYTFFYNQSVWEQKQKDLETNAKEYASLTDYDLTNSIPKFSKEIQQKYNDLYSYVQANPDVMDYKNNQKGWLEYRKMKQDFETDLLNAKSQDAIYKSGQSLIEKETRPEVKAFLQKQLEDQVAAKDLKTPIRLQQYDAEPTVLPGVPVRKFDIIRMDAKGDMIIDREMEVADQKAINNLAGSIALGLQGESLDANSEAFKQLPLDVQTFKIEESKKRKATGRQAVVEEAKIFTEALQNFKDPSTGKIDIGKVAASNPIIAGSLQAVIDYNKQMDDEVAKIRSGYYSDNLVALKFGVNGLEEKDYQKIDYSDGEITATDLLKVQLRAKAPQPSFKTEAKELDSSIRRAQLSETIRHNKASESLASEDNKLNQEKWKASQTGSTTQVNGAMERAKRIYSDMQKLTDKYGVISPDKIRQLNVEQLKYLGIEVPQERDAEGKIISQGGFKPLTFEDETQYAIQLINGEIRVLKPKSGEKVIEKTVTGGYRGLFDPTKSTNIYNVGTNILNEELKNAGAKELNSYFGVDVTGTPIISTEGGTQTQSGSSKKSGGMTDEEYKIFLKKNGLK